MDQCFCGKQSSYEDCCQPYINGLTPIPDAESLMRSRYSAYAQANITYIEKTMLGKAAVGFDPISAKQWAESATWLGLQVIDVSQENNELAFVEFIASYQSQGQAQQLHERSEFRLIDGQWFYVDGEMPKLSMQNIKVGRNDPCPCGSGKKYKKCCL